MERRITTTKRKERWFLTVIKRRFTWMQMRMMMDQTRHPRKQLPNQLWQGSS
jgi:hypothetical protein